MTNLHDYRVDLGWSINKLASEAGISRQVAANAEKGVPVTAEKAKAIADALSKAYGREIRPSEIGGILIL
jgi:transcriptional regulator with XRE-family HTH domain